MTKELLNTKINPTEIKVGINTFKPLKKCQSFKKPTGKYKLRNSKTN